MGLMIHSLGGLPLNAERAYYIYLLDYGWHEPLSDAVYRNFDKMADRASRHNAVVMRGTCGAHFADEVLSWHKINGQSAEELLPAILITTRHPKSFHSEVVKSVSNDRLLLIPLRKACNTTSDVVSLIEKIFADIRSKKVLSNFAVAKELKKGEGGALVDALILQPNVGGMGLDLKALGKFFKGLRK